jgi:hypothetical protein
MEQNKSLFEEWESGVGLGRAWWAFASTQNRNRIRELQRTGQHLGLQLSLEDDLIARISAGELRAFGFEGGSGDAGPVLIPQRYFWRKEEIDWDKETVAAIGKKFHEVRVRGEREPADEWTTKQEPTDPWPIRKEPESSDETLPSEPEPLNDPPARTEIESGDEALRKPLIGRPPLVPMVVTIFVRNDRALSRSFANGTVTMVNCDPRMSLPLRGILPVTQAKAIASNANISLSLVV